MKQNNGSTVIVHRKNRTTQKQYSILPGLLLIGTGIMVLVALIIFSTNNSAGVSIGRVKIGSRLGDFSLTDLTGKTVRLGDYAGKPVLINAWATWCPPCRAEMPTLNQYYQAHQNQGLILLAVNAGDPQSSASDFASQNGLTFRVLLDPGTRLLDALGINDTSSVVAAGFSFSAAAGNFATIVKLTRSLMIVPAPWLLLSLPPVIIITIRTSTLRKSSPGSCLGSWQLPSSTVQGGFSPKSVAPWPKQENF